MTIPNDFSARSEHTGETDAKRTALLIAEIAQSKHAEKIVIFHVSALTSLADFFVICSAESLPQIRAISEAVEDTLSKEGQQPLGVEGRSGGVWTLMDYSDVIFHIFQEESREFYGLDRLWGDAPQIMFSPIALEADPLEDQE
ncbi:Ribosomal silencing factor RsfA [hydrothermal vent metagenome]|uniref:Ribosomal silencing factor RsfA n=1 Tax=hydrothermal vent metagenome TaxID=652676 RepID=A0A3B1D8B6_9ZZZZ